MKSDFWFVLGFFFSTTPESGKRKSPNKSAVGSAGKGDIEFVEVSGTNGLGSALPTAGDAKMPLEKSCGVQSKRIQHAQNQAEPSSMEMMSLGDTF